MKIRNKKGFGLVTAIMIITVLFIMAAGFLSISDYSTRSSNANVRNLTMYWAAESASNYNVNWWINLPDTVRIKWPNIYEAPSTKGAVYQDINGTTTYASKFPKGENTAQGDIVYLHQSSLVEGNADIINPELDNFNGLKLITVRYKGPRLNKPSEAVWILDSYSWNPENGDWANVCLTNVFNYDINNYNPLWEMGESINTTLAMSGFHGVKGRFNEQDTRYGPCYYGGLVHFDYITGSTKKGPTFYGIVKSSSQDVSWYKTDKNLFTDLTDNFAYGLGINSAAVSNQAEADDLARTSLLAGYVNRMDRLPTDNVIWTWEDIVKFGPSRGIYFPTVADGFSANSVINVKLETKDVGGARQTFANLYLNNNFSKIIKTLPIGKGTGKNTGIAVPKGFGTVTIEGRCGEDFALATETSQVYVTNHFYLDEMQPTLDWFLKIGNKDLAVPKEEWLERMWQEMIDIDPKGHMAVLSQLGVETFDKNKPPIYFPIEKEIFSTSAYITKFGELTAKGVGNTPLRLYNIGPTMVLDQQEIMSGPADTAQKWPKVFIQDNRYTDPDENLPPMCGTSPSFNWQEDLYGLNRLHRWSSELKGNSPTWETVVWRNL